ncbi:starch synthase [Alkalithermobacter thermoalcaliphilus JW-YL-7 = DSM 7308]|uniref:Glycogen synthase n=1 Tax=Alkalithermobacter thermoalcaliphilus JW-YL-7 = DSM 7308 TaxID=1121328 RepID=A0A150FRU3_CLOPD|nr:Glycogen synthase [[Clostridium] paradoxum JW-YL-7 = DSM 7308]SHK62172.1 starch synthase [[Clostridium] paradoxum JW-YL-7 = DSM 7308]
MLKLLYVASEGFPFVKTGGLGDVAYSLPKELRKKGIDVRVVLPKYNAIPERYKSNMKLIKSIYVQVGWRMQYCGIEYLENEGVPYYFIDNEYYFKREGGYYGFYDDAERFSFYNRAVLEMIDHIDFKPDIIHCNDWHTGMIPVFLKAHYNQNPRYYDIKTMFTIHNLKYQGIFPPEILGDLLNLGMEYYNQDAIEFYGAINFMKGGINFSDVVTTVSPSYSQEIQYPYFGEKLDGLLRYRKEKLYGILNGIDYDVYNPLTDKNIFVNYDINCINKKYENKLFLQEQVGLDKRQCPVISMVTRLDEMKGLDLVIHVLDEILSNDIQMIILGTGDAKYEHILSEYQTRYKGKLSVNNLFDNTLAHRIYAGSDMLLMPSKFEPCGLSQLIALRYGTIPIVRNTGGLKDTITHYNNYNGNGFVFDNYNAHDMLYIIQEAISVYNDKNRWNTIVNNAMTKDYSWTQSALEYKKLYENLTRGGNL